MSVKSLNVLFQNLKDRSRNNPNALILLFGIHITPVIFLLCILLLISRERVIWLG